MTTFDIPNVGTEGTHYNTLPALPDWISEGECINLPLGESTLVFFPEGPNTKWADREAKAICRECAVRAACAEFGNGEFAGTWGGVTERERRASNIDLPVQYWPA